MHFVPSLEAHTAPHPKALYWILGWEGRFLGFSVPWDRVVLLVDLGPRDPEIGAHPLVGQHASWG